MSDAMNLIPILAEIELPGAVSKGTNLVPGLLFKDTVLIGGGVLFIVIILVAWAVFIRKPRREPDRVYPSSKKLTAEEQAESGRRRKKRREPRRSHRSRNPTLADTGGLPPARVGDSQELS
jgi:hypothetical protein